MRLSSHQKKVHLVRPEGENLATSRKNSRPSTTQLVIIHKARTVMLPHRHFASTALVFSVALSLLLASSTGLQAQAQSAGSTRLWTSSDGKTLDASFVKTEGTNIVLLLADGREVSVPAARLSNADIAYIKQLPPPQAAKATPGEPPNQATEAPKSYGFSVSWDKEKQSETQLAITGIKGKIINWQPVFKVTSRCTVPLENLMLIYSVQINRDLGKKASTPIFATGFEVVPTIKPNETLIIKAAKTFEAINAKVQNGYETTDGSRANKSDTVFGASTRLIHDLKVVHSFKSAPGVQDRLDALTALTIKSK
jgi:SLA1 homology domain 1, SHD1